MKQIYIIAALIIFSVIAIVAINAGINGFVISQSCCFGTGCSAENLCDAAHSRVEYTSIYPELFIGIVSVAIISSFLYLNKKE